MPKGAASLPATRRRSYEANVDWVRYLNRSAARFYKAEHGSWPSQNAPNRKAVCARYEDRRRERRRRATRQRRIDSLPHVLEREQRVAASIANDSRLTAAYDLALRKSRDLNARRGARGLNALPEPDRPQLGLALQPLPDGWSGNVGRIRRIW
jgi:hypothetical protein